MSFSSAELTELDLVSAINQSPLTVALDTPVMQVIDLMSQRFSSADSQAPQERDRSCVLVLDEQKIVGIFTERDIVRLSAAEADLAQKMIQEVMISPVRTLDITNLNDVFAVLFLFRRYAIRHLPVIDEVGHLVGLVSQASLRQILKPANLLKLRRVGDVMTTGVVWAHPSTSVLTIAKLMAEKRVSCVILAEQIQDDRLNPVGILTERDLVQFQTLRLDLSSLMASEVMSSPLMLLDPQDSLWHAHQEMKRYRIRRLVVSWNWGKNLGLVTQTSLLRAFDPMEMYSIIETLQQTIQQLEAEKRELQQLQTNTVGSPAIKPKDDSVTSSGM